MKAMTKNVPVIKNAFERLLIVLGVVASKILNYFFFSRVFLILSWILAIVCPKIFAISRKIAKGIMRFAYMPVADTKENV